MALSIAPFGTYTTLGGTLTAAQKTAFAANLTSLKALFSSTTPGTPISGGGQGVAAAQPDFDGIKPSTLLNIITELTNLGLSVSTTSTT